MIGTAQLSINFDKNLIKFNFSILHFSFGRSHIIIIIMIIMIITQYDHDDTQKKGVNYKLIDLFHQNVHPKFSVK